VLVQRTLKGSVFLRDLRETMAEAEGIVAEMPLPETLAA